MLRISRRHIWFISPTDLFWNYYFHIQFPRTFIYRTRSFENNNPSVRCHNILMVSLRNGRRIRSEKGGTSFSVPLFIPLSLSLSTLNVNVDRLKFGIFLPPRYNARRCALFMLSRDVPGSDTFGFNTHGSSSSTSKLSKSWTIGSVCCPRWKKFEDESDRWAFLPSLTVIEEFQRINVYSCIHHSRRICWCHKQLRCVCINIFEYINGYEISICF